MVSDENVETNKSKVRAWAANPDDPERWRNDFAPDFRFTVIGTTPISGTVVGEDGVHERFDEFMKHFVSLEMTLDALIGEGDVVVHVARSDGQTDLGKPYRNRHATVFRFEHGKVVSVTEYLDTALIETAVFGKQFVEAAHDAG